MNKNMGSADRIVRLIIAATIVVLYFTNVIGGTAGIVLLFLSGVFTLTSFAGTCPLYTLLRINSCKKLNQ
ncbi:MAG: DUF2892 domain-containing protein [Bacteroidota bacterium]